MTNITVNQLLDLAATDDLKLNFYDEAHQISETTCEQDMAAYATLYNWSDAVIEYWYPTSANELRIKCTLANTVPLELIAIAASLDAIAESLSLIRDSACEQYKFDDLLVKLYTWHDELIKRHDELIKRSKDPCLVAENADKMKDTAALLNVLDEFIIDIMVAAEPERDTDACAVNILNSECIATLTLTRRLEVDA